MATAQVKHHDYHLVDPSPWPIVGSISAFIMAVGAITWMHHMSAVSPIIFGGCTIGASAADGVVDPYHRTYGHAGLHIVGEVHGLGVGGAEEAGEFGESFARD